MRYLITTLIYLFPFFIKSQILIEFDRMETFSTLYSTAGWWTPALTANWFTNVSVSPNQSAVIYGSGNGSSLNEQDWYSLPNKTGLDPNRQYQLRFRLSSNTFTNSTAATRGVDVADIVDVQVSTNGVNYISELRITGNNNSTWPYTSSGVINHTANGIFTNSLSPTGDVYQSPSGVNTTGPSTINLTFPYGITQIAIDIFCRVNSAGEEWWIDNIELWDITPIPLPVELISFDGFGYPQHNLLTWSTATEYNSDYFIIQRSLDGFNWVEIGYEKSVGNSTEKVDYSFIDVYRNDGLTYYKLSQYDFDGKCDEYGPISIFYVKPQKKIIKYLNILGQEVDMNYTGVILEVYEDQTTKKIIR